MIWDPPSLPSMGGPFSYLIHYDPIVKETKLQCKPSKEPYGAKIWVHTFAHSLLSLDFIDWLVKCSHVGQMLVDYISYIPCLRVVPSWSCPIPPLWPPSVAAKLKQGPLIHWNGKLHWRTQQLDLLQHQVKWGGHTGSRGQLQRCHLHTRDVTILLSYFPSANVLWWCRSSIFMFRPEHWPGLPLFACHSDFPTFFPERDTRFQRATQGLVSPSGLEEGDTTLSIFALS